MPLSLAKDRNRHNIHQHRLPLRQIGLYTSLSITVELRPQLTFLEEEF